MLGLNLKLKFFLLQVSFFSFIILNAQNSNDSIKPKHTQIFPVISRSVETDWSFGIILSKTFHLKLKDTTTRTSNMQAIALYSLKKQFVTALNGATYLPHEKFIFNYQISYSSFPDKFWGLGENAPDSNQESYSFKQYYVYLHLLRKLGNNFFAGGLFELQNVSDVDYMKGGLFEKQNVTGRNGYFISGFGGSLTYDNRKDAFAPNKGSFMQLYFDHFDKIFGSTYNYTNVVLDIRKYFRIHNEQVLALQAYSFNNFGDSIPLRSLANFGGANKMRGFYDGRYRDKNQLVFQAEYRIQLIKRVGVTFFGSFGDVGNKFFDYSFNNLKYSYGGGLRFAINKSEKLNIRLDYGIGQNNNDGFYLQLGEAF